MKYIDGLLNKITMYRLVLYCLIGLSIIAIIFGFVGIISYRGSELSISLILLLAICSAVNYAFAKLYKAPVNIESTFITAYILFLIMFPAGSVQGALYLALTGFIAVASKYVIALNHKHLFNPAAFAPALLGFTPIGGAAWWVGSMYLLPLTLIAGLLIVRKIRREVLFFSCVVASIITVIVLGVVHDSNLLDIIKQHFLSWPIIFFAAVMVTEPLTTPPTKRLQIIYGALVGTISSWPFHIGTIFSTPELTLVMANLFSYSVSLRRRLTLVLKSKQEIATGTYEFIFDPGCTVAFKAGQYLEWTLPHAKPDDRGNRRYFTVASSPTERNLHLGVRYGDTCSSFKRALMNLEPGGHLTAGQLAGDFTLPADTTLPLVFIAGGIGITPFRSMIKYLLDKKESRDIILFYTNRTAADIAYNDLFAEGARVLKLKTVYILTERGAVPGDWSGETGFITADMIKKHVPNFSSRQFYLSGPNGMVDSYAQLLKTMGVNRRQIHSDYFPGFA